MNRKAFPFFLTVCLALFIPVIAGAAPKGKAENKKKTQITKKKDAKKATAREKTPRVPTSAKETKSTEAAAPARAVNVPEPAPESVEETAARPDRNSEPNVSGSASSSTYVGNLHYRYRMSAQTGINILSGKGSGYLMGAQFGYAPSTGTSFYLGPEVDFSLFSPGSMLQVMAAAWYEVRVYGAPRLSLSLGGAIGPAFATSLTELSSTTVGGYLEACIAQDVNDIATLRSQFRPGFVGGYFSFMMNFSVQFRFL